MLTPEEINIHLKETNVRVINGQLIKNRFPDLYEYLMTYPFPKDFPIMQRFYHYMHNDMEMQLGRCPMCGNRVLFRSYRAGYYKNCSHTCSANNPKTKELQIKTNLERYGVEHTSRLEETTLKREKTMLERHGATNTMNCPKIRAKIEKTMIERHGGRCSAYSKEIKDKIEDICMKKYGKRSGGGSEQAKKKRKQTNLKKYKKEYTLEAKEVQDKIKKTNMEKHGYEYPFQSDEVQKAYRMLYYEKRGGYHAYFPKIDNYPEYKKEIFKKFGRKWLDTYQINSEKYIKNFERILNENSIPFEKNIKIDNYTYDYKVKNCLVDINFTITHNSCLNIFEETPLNTHAHNEKITAAREKGYKCMQIWEWENPITMANYFKDKKTINAEETEIIEIPLNVVNAFLYRHSWMPKVTKPEICYGLRYGTKLVQIMVFAKPMHDKNREWELLRHCTHNEYNIEGGYEKLFNYFVDNYKPKSILNYCDLSKDTGQKLDMLGFKEVKYTIKIKVWHNPITGNRATTNMLMSRFFKHTLAEPPEEGEYIDKTMLKNGYLPIFSCGMRTLVWSL